MEHQLPIFCVLSLADQGSGPKFQWSVEVDVCELVKVSKPPLSHPSFSIDNSGEIIEEAT